MHIELSLLDGVAHHAQHPATFWIPSDEEKKYAVENCQPVKLCFHANICGEEYSERMWVEVEHEKDGIIYGKLDNDPAFLFPFILRGEHVEFEFKHIINV